MRKLFVVSAWMALIAGGIYALWVHILKPDMPRIAHAGGGLNGQTYTNSLQALDSSYQKGFRYFEIDLIWTKDDRLVCLHDWGKTAQRLWGYEGGEPVTLEVFNALVDSRPEITSCTLDSLNQWMRRHPGTFIITDIKDRNIEGLELVAQKIDRSHKRIIPQFYQPEEYDSVRAIGYKKMIWTLYQFTGSREDVLEQVAPMKLFAVTMPRKRAYQGVAADLDAVRVSTYVHTINEEDRAIIFHEKYFASSIYTDFLLP